MTEDGVHVSVGAKSALDVARLACEEAGKVLLKHFRNLKDVSHKGRGNLVTEADISSEKVIVDIIRREFPRDGFITEESASEESHTGYYWVIDPLDGTNNYFFGLPHFAINIGLLRKEGDSENIVLGLTYAPVYRELFYAERGKGTFLNDAPVHVSGAGKLTDCLVGYDMGYSDERGKEMLGTASSLWPGVHSMRVMGSAALGLAYVACGRFGLYFHKYLFPWDIAPGILLVREAGGIIENWEGGPVTLDGKTVVASSSVLMEEFRAKISGNRISGR